MFEDVRNSEELALLVRNSSAVLLYFSTDECNVCKVLKPKIEQLIVSNFPQIKLVYININTTPEIAASYHVFTAPTMLILFENKELLRKGRSFGIYELGDELARPYQLLFS